MYKIDVIIKPFELENVRDALACLGIHGMTVTEVKVTGDKEVHSRLFENADHPIELLPKLKIEIIVSDSTLKKTVETICNSVNTNDNKKDMVFITNVTDAIRIRTFQKGEDAIT